MLTTPDTSPTEENKAPTPPEPPSSATRKENARPDSVRGKTKRSPEAAHFDGLLHIMGETLTGLDSSGVTSVQAIETTVDPAVDRDYVPSGEQRRLWCLRDRVTDRLADVDSDAIQKRRSRMGGCSRFPSIRVNATTGPYLSRDRCRDRVCPICAAKRGRDLAVKLADILQHADALRHLTLTLEATTEPLRVQVDHLLASFRRLRQHQQWGRHVSGGVACVQVTKNAVSGLWHPHLHVVVDGEYFAHPIIKEAWARASKGATIVHITRSTSVRSTARYIARYVASPDDLGSWSGTELAEYALALHGRRLVLAFGNLHGSKLPPKEKEDPKGPSQMVCHIAAIQWGIRNGSRSARRVFELTTLHYPGIAYAINPARPLMRSIERDPPVEVRMALVDAAVVAMDEYSTQVVNRPPPPPVKPPPPSYLPWEDRRSVT